MLLREAFWSSRCTCTYVVVRVSVSISLSVESTCQSIYPATHLPPTHPPPTGWLLRSPFSVVMLQLSYRKCSALENHTVTVWLRVCLDDGWLLGAGDIWKLVWYTSMYTAELAAVWQGYNGIAAFPELQVWTVVWSTTKNHVDLLGTNLGAFRPSRLSLCQIYQPV